MLNRTILWELIKIFALSLVGITGLLLLAGVVMEAQSQGLTPMQILVITPLIVPSTLPYTIPTTTLFATCVVYGRLAHDNEILAIRSAGINILRIIWPAFLLGVVTSLVTLLMYFQVIPTTYHLMKTMFLEEIEGFIYSKLQREGEFYHPRLDYEVAVKRVQGKKLIDPVFKHRNPQTGKYDIVARASEAELMVDMAHRQILIHMWNCHVSTQMPGDSVYIEDKWWPVDFPPDFIVVDRKSRRTDMTWEELLARKAKLEQKIRSIDDEIALSISRKTLAHPPKNLAEHIKNLREMKKHQYQLLWDVEAEMQRRPALAFGCLCFVLVGCPVGIWFSKSDYLSAFVTCFLPVVLIYYPLVLCGENLARTGTLDPAVAIWSANGLFALVALILYRRLLRN